MKLSYFSNQTVPKGQWGGGVKLPRISFSKAGTISLNKPAIELLKLKEGDKVSLAQDEDEPANWYIFLDPDNGFELRTKDLEKACCYTFNHNALKNVFLEAFSLPSESTHNFLLAGEPTTFGKTLYWGILVPTES